MNIEFFCFCDKKSITCVAFLNVPDSEDSHLYSMYIVILYIRALRSQKSILTVIESETLIISLKWEKGVEKICFFSWEAWWKFCMNAWQPRAPYSLKQNRKLLKHFMMNFKLGKGQPDPMHSLNNWFSPENDLPPHSWVTLRAAECNAIVFMRKPILMKGGAFQLCVQKLYLTSISGEKAAAN